MNSPSTSTRLEHIQTNFKEISFPRLLILLFVGSLLIHLIVVALFINQPIALNDMFQYDMLARSLKEGKGFRWYSKADVEILRPYYSQFLDIDNLHFPPEGLRTTFRAPGYPFFLAFLYLFVPDSLRFVLARLAQAGLVSALAPLTALLSHHTGFSRKVSILSGIGISLYPILLFYPIGLVSENLYILLGLSSLVAIIIVMKKKSLGWVLIAGLLCGMTMFTRSIFAIYVLLAGGWISWSSPYKKKAGLLFLLVAFGLCLPWSIRNSLIIGRPAFIETSAGYQLFIGYHPEGDGGFVSRIAIIPMNILDDGERDKICFQQAIAFIRQNPFEAVRRIFVRLVKFIGPEDREFFYFYSNNLMGAIPQPWISLIYSLLVIPWGSSLILGVSGLWLTKDRRIVKLIAIYLLGYGLPHLFIIAEPRFHLTWVPVLIPFAMHAWTSRKEIYCKVCQRDNIVFVGIIILIACIYAIGLVSNFPKLLLIMSPGGNELYLPY